MNCQRKAPKHVIEILKDNGVDYIDIDYYAWPQLFGGTAGPSMLAGGATISAFTVEAYVCAPCGPTVYICCGMFYYEDKRFEPFKNISAWKKI